LTWDPSGGRLIADVLGSNQILKRGFFTMRLRPVIVTLLFVVSLSNKVPAGAQFPPLAVAPFDGPAAELHQQTWAKHLKVDVEIKNSLGMKLRLIPAGEFQMGSSESEEERISDEQQHTVRITKAFYLGKYEVTQGEWKAVMGSEPWKGQQFGKEGAEFPATSVSWEAAADFCQKLSKKEGKEYRLPTEAEWEYACRGGKATRFHFGDDETVFGGYAWYDKNALDINEQYAHPVGQKKKNPFGLYDMHGNVWEWSSDWYAEKYYASSPTNDPQGSETGSIRVHRGGSWGSWPVYCRSALRNGDSPSAKFGSLGFRLACSSIR